MHYQGPPRILILRAAGINCDEETAAACELAGGKVERLHINQLAIGRGHLADYAALVIPGGFSYGDHLGAGKLLAVDLQYRLGEVLAKFVEDGRPVLGICNGFQVLVRAGLLPGGVAAGRTQQAVTLAGNASGHYECRWTYLLADPQSSCLFTRGLEGRFALPVGHGEGRFVADPAMITHLQSGGQVAVRYVDAQGQPAADYPQNPNGSLDAIAGICNPQGNVFGLMPHPDRAYLPQLHPDWLGNGRHRQEGDGLAIFRNMVAYVTA